MLSVVIVLPGLVIPGPAESMLAVAHLVKFAKGTRSEVVQKMHQTPIGEPETIVVLVVRVIICNVVILVLAKDAVMVGERCCYGHSKVQVVHFVQTSNLTTEGFVGALGRIIDLVQAFARAMVAVYQKTGTILVGVPCVLHSSDLIPPVVQKGTQALDRIDTMLAPRLIIALVGHILARVAVPPQAIIANVSAYADIKYYTMVAMRP